MPKQYLPLLGQPIALYRNSQVLCKAATNVSGDFPNGTPSGMSPYETVIETLTTLFPVWVILGTIIGIYKSAAVTWLQTDLSTLGLGFLMLSMGLTLTFEDFRRCMRNPWTVGIGFLAQYLIKPMLGFVIALMRTVLKVVDNLGAKKVMCIQALKGKKRARLGDTIVALVKEAHPNGKVKKGKVVYGMVVHASMQRGRCDSIEVKFDDNDVVLVDKQGQPIGT
ncbi:hypothetical protein CMV_020043 [Castanea mollissima]|uniref:Uncharacterized protein n=1 Tax=Castanea mollissima TaxID=60419 RepID=A0A8J4QM46_9ROSI|nr:hypothetical protein CMV_020043 [Castanea mollissima]